MMEKDTVYGETLYSKVAEFKKVAVGDMELRDSGGFLSMVKCDEEVHYGIVLTPLRWRGGHGDTYYRAVFCHAENAYRVSEREEWQNKVSDKDYELGNYHKTAAEAQVKADKINTFINEVFYD